MLDGMVEVEYIRIFLYS